ncbi:endonuclease/exonuclease/phosphatase family protein [Flammeovirga sp. EKP202]|uniref:endonuclease/exonuclease/phosphatase family protein n=1 Tax=Flammeovirga sp. EKP202 TaxID=2770592 RepID=UPI00165EE85F|nr:endonuclease/exonuclease/phosphatase family protein [Flammeovirga sp. EKP202]MBD0405117.1 endonuclease/exonuclease/phosphatase family protein [Flammeovirga sp. EKP202]
MSLPTTPIEYDDTLVKCLNVAASNETLEVLTWNIEHFPKHEETTGIVNATIAESDYDLWGVQEIEGVSFLKQVKQVNPKYSVLVDTDIAKGVNNDYHLAYVYQNERLELLDQQVLASGDFDGYYFPRRPLLAKFLNKVNNQTFYVINLHLKCCNREYDDRESDKQRRTEASKRLQKYIDENLDNEYVIVLGDFNEEIYPTSTSSFKNFIDDSGNYAFSTMDQAKSDNSLDKSYPNWWPNGSHIDHILITNEWFNKYQKSYTLSLDQCSEYEYFEPKVSDHRPVMTVFRN